ncbi:hypothetical protein Y032_0392g582 [Ancylostoma ceylanicum]|uniref:Uncharacterized protein n=1 Tax=Ancylostoma ceylanicum TaxID=53326 RepID=A0A016RS27_9BILA|nr:hypothetical protein Y032_0392g582 [Ancylostoma ceylanicum]
MVQVLRTLGVAQINQLIKGSVQQSIARHVRRLLKQYHPSRQYLFVPPALSSLHIKPNSCQLVASYSESANQTGFTFSVSWTNEDSTAKIKTANDDDNDLVLSIRAPVDETSKFLSSVKHSTKGATSRENILCDGPCGRRYPPESMKVLGRCGHFLCDVCYGLVYNDDGKQFITVKKISL